MSDRWITALVEREGSATALTVDLSHMEFRDEALGHCVEVAITLQNPREDGLPKGPDEEPAYALEDALLDAADGVVGLTHVGTASSEGVRVLVLYAAEPDAAVAALREAAGAHGGIEHAIEVQEDSEWSMYFGVLLPTNAEIARMRDLQTLAALQENGDRPEAERPVDFFLHFRTPEQRTACIEELMVKGWRLVDGISSNYEQEFPFVCQVARRMPATPDAIFPVVEEMMERADRFGALYDGWGCPIAR